MKPRIEKRIMITNRYLLGAIILCTFGLAYTAFAETFPSDYSARTKGFLDNAEQTARNRSAVPESFWTWLNSKPEIRAGLLASHDPVHPGAVKNLFYLNEELGARVADQYAHLLLAAAVAQKDVDIRTNRSHNRTEIGPDMPKKRGADSAAIEQAANEFARLMKAEGLSLLEATSNKQALALLDEFSDKDKKNIYSKAGVVSGTFPAKQMSTAGEFFTALIKRYETKLPAFNDGGPEWPLFPIDKAPWPMLMPLSRTAPLDECQYVWDHFTGQKAFPKRESKKAKHKNRGPRRIITYSRYSWDYKEPEFNLKQSEWSPGSLPRIIEDGGVCGRQSQLGRGSYAALGKPSLRMGQPGHSALLSFNVSPDGDYWAKPEQSIKSMNLSKVDWQFRDAFTFGKIGDYKVGVEYLQGLTMAMNHGLTSYIESRVALHLAKRLAPEQSKERIALLAAAVKISPYNVQAWYTMAEEAGSDIPMINEIINHLYQYTGISDATNLEFDDARDASTDFNEVAGKTTTGAVGKNASMTVLVIAMNIVKHAYPLALEEKVHLKEAYTYLQKQALRQKAMKKSPYTGILTELLGQFEIALNGVESFQKKTTEYVISEINRTKKQPKTKGKKNKKNKKDKIDAERIQGEIQAVLEAMENADEKYAWLQVFRDAFDKAYEPNRLYKINKKGQPAVSDPTYKYIVDQQLKVIRSKGNKFKHEAAKFQKALQKQADQIKSD
jgi:hypothetical protein